VKRYERERVNAQEHRIQKPPALDRTNFKRHLLHKLGENPESK
jgi:hypothetical protein